MAVYQRFQGDKLLNLVIDELDGLKILVEHELLQVGVLERVIVEFHLKNQELRLTLAMF